MRRMIPVLLAIFTALSMLTGNLGALNQFALQVGAWGDDASKGNMGVQVEIRTHIYNAGPSAFDYFWVGDNLDSGAFIQFGYSFESGYYCLRGQIIGGRVTCTGNSEQIASFDARWQWQYWPNIKGEDFYYGIGPANSAGAEGTWHVYSIMPNVENSWTFVLDGQPVDSVFFAWTRSKDPAYAVAEKVTSSGQFGSLGPVEFRNLAYLSDKTGVLAWHTVNSLYAIRGCAVNTVCNFEIPYGVTLLGPNHIAAGSGGEKVENGAVVWTSQVVLTIQLPTTVHAVVDGVDHGAGSVQLLLPSGLHIISVPAIVQVDNSTRLRFSGWNDGLSVADRTVYLDSDMALQASYVRQYLVTMDSGLIAPRSDWGDEGSLVQFSVPSSTKPMSGLFGLLGGDWVFTGWYEGNTLLTRSISGSISVYSPHALKAHWQADYTRPIMILGSVAVLTVIGLLFYARRRPSSSRDSFGPESRIEEVSTERTGDRRFGSFSPSSSQAPQPIQETIQCLCCGAKIARISKFCNECGHAVRHLRSDTYWPGKTN